MTTLIGMATDAAFGSLAVRQEISRHSKSLEGELLRYTNKVLKCFKKKQNA